MFPLEAARILNNEANETNYKAIVKDLIGIAIDPEILVENNNEIPKAEPRIETMGPSIPSESGVLKIILARP